MGKGYVKNRLEPLVSAQSQGSLDAMFEKLHRRVLPPATGFGRESPGVSSAPEATATAAGGIAQDVPGMHGEPMSAASAPRERHLLEWERVNAYAMRTLCGTWTCSKVFVGGEPVYELFRRIAGLERPVCVRRGLESFEDAKGIAQAEEDEANGAV